MITDFHTHTFPDRLAGRVIPALSAKAHSVAWSDGTNAGLVRAMDRAGVMRSVVLPVATTPHQTATINRTAEQVTASSGGRLVSFGGIHPDSEDVEAILEGIREAGLKGIKVHPVYQRTDLDDPRYLRIFRACVRYHLIVVTHGGYDIGYPGSLYATPEKAARVLDAVPDLTLVVAHMGGWRQWREAAGYLKGRSVYVDTAFSTGAFMPLDDGYWKKEDTYLLKQEEFLRLVDVYGADHVLFGTDSPWSDQRQALRFVQEALGEGTALRDVLEDNAERLLGGQGV